MKIIGFSSGATGKAGNVDRMVQAVLAATGWETEFVKLTDLQFTGCKGCVDKCAQPQVCVLEDEAKPYFQKLKDADAVVLGTANYFGSVNTIMTSFIERFFGYRHVSNAIAGKPFVAVMSGFREGGEEGWLNYLRRFGIDPVGSVYFCSASPPCFFCGRHQECRIGGLYHTYGDAALTMDITPDKLLQWEDCPQTGAAVQAAAEALKLYEED